MNYKMMDPIKAENERKDLLLMKLKSDVFEMRQKDRDYKALHETFIQLQHRASKLAEEKVLSHRA